MTKGDKGSDNEWQRVITSDNEWQRMAGSGKNRVILSFKMKVYNAIYNYYIFSNIDNL